jgi:hypothetical protein
MKKEIVSSMPRLHDGVEHVQGFEKQICKKSVIVYVHYEYSFETCQIEVTSMLSQAGVEEYAATMSVVESNFLPQFR